MKSQHKGGVWGGTETEGAINKLLGTLKKLERVSQDEQDPPYKLPYSTPVGKKSQWKVTRKA